MCICFAAKPWKVDIFEIQHQPLRVFRSQNPATTRGNGISTCLEQLLNDIRCCCLSIAMKYSDIRGAELRQRPCKYFRFPTAIRAHL